ncbi:MAG: response regulator transcription factor [Isosphaeraceae bacterium]
MGIRILIVEDEAELADFVVRGLREEGFTVEHAADGDLGWAAMRSGEWDLIVLDWWLPGEEGLSLVKRYRGAGGTAPVLFLTARDAVADRVRGLDAGADDYLGKPFAFDELLARVRARVRRRDRSTEMTLSHGDITVDLAAQRARRAGKPLELTAKELALLTFFLRHPGQVLSRTRIYDHVWDETFDGLSNTLEVHVMELRRKLEAHGPRVIQTVRGRGYMYEAPPALPPGSGSESEGS